MAKLREHSGIRIHSLLVGTNAARGAPAASARQDVQGASVHQSLSQFLGPVVLRAAQIETPPLNSVALAGMHGTTTLGG